MKSEQIKWYVHGKLLSTHSGRVTHICVGNRTIIGSDNILSPHRRRAIIWTNAGILLIGPLGTNFSEMLIDIHIFSSKKIHLKMSSGKWRPFCLGLNVFIHADFCIWVIHSMRQILSQQILYNRYRNVQNYFTYSMFSHEESISILMNITNSNKVWPSSSLLVVRCQKKGYFDIRYHPQNLSSQWFIGFRLWPHTEQATSHYLNQD